MPEPTPRQYPLLSNAPIRRHSRSIAFSTLLCALLLVCWLPTAPWQPATGSLAMAASTKKRDAYPLPRLKLLRFVLQMIQRYYVDPTQFSPDKMFRSSLLHLEQKLTSFQVKFTKDAVEVQLGPHKQRFATKSHSGLFDVWLQLHPIATFIDKHHHGKMSRADIEHFLVLGVMTTLDKQTMIINPKHYKGRRKKSYKSGKIGVYLQMKEAKLWITQVIPEGPADQAGLQGGDQIERIEGERVSGGTLWDWSAKIRGLRGTRLALHILRKGWKQSQRFVLIRAAMPTPNVTGHLLPGKIGYVRLRQFIAGSSLAIREQLARIRHQAKGSLLGLILDLRNNGGGLVSEAVAICSLFVEKGEVTTYAGANIKRRTYNVSGTNTEERYPMITLINGYSASASELLSGALQSHNRSLILGRQSYGKGTVQRAGPMGMMGLYVRITIAQYMLPRSQSIQAVGITPDVEILPVQLQSNHIRYYSVKPRDQAMRRKRWPKFLLQNLDPQEADKSWAQIHYLLPANNQRTTPTKRTKAKRTKAKRTKAKRTKAQKTNDAKRWYKDPSHPLGADFDVWFARYLLSHTQSARRDIFFSQIKRPLQQATQQEEAQVVKALRKLGLDWRRPPKTLRRKTQLSAQLTLQKADTPLQTGKAFTLQLTVKNIGKSVAYRTRAILYANSKTLLYREILIGQLRPGQKRSQPLTLTLSDKEISRVDILRIEVEAEGANTMKPITMQLPWRAPTRPSYAVAVHIQDPAPDGNGDGRLQPGERATLFVSAHNDNNAASPALQMLLVPGSLRTLHPRHKLGKVGANQQRTVTYSIHVPDNAKVGPVGARLVLYDPTLRHLIQHRLDLRVASAFSGLTKASQGWATTTQAVVLRASPTDQANPIAYAPKGSSFRVVHTWKEYVKVQLPASLFPPNPATVPPKKTKQTQGSRKSPTKATARPHLPKGLLPPENKRIKAPPLRSAVALSAWLHKRMLRIQPTGKSRSTGLRPHFHYQPPKIRFLWPKYPYQTTSAKIQWPISITSTQGIKDIYVQRGKRKLFYLPVQYKQPHGRQSLERKLPLTLKPGVNQLKLTVRTAKSSFQRTLYITYIP